MKKILSLLFLMGMLLINSSKAETLVLVSGKEIIGKIVSRTDSTVIIENDQGRKVTYYTGEIKEIKADDGSVLSSAPVAVTPPSADVSAQSDTTTPAVPISQTKNVSTSGGLISYGEDPIGYYLKKENAPEQVRKVYKNSKEYYDEQFKGRIEELPGNINKFFTWFDNKFPGVREFLRVNIIEKISSFIKSGEMKKWGILLGIYYLFFTIPFVMLARRFREDMFWSMVPIVNVFMLLKIAERSYWEIFILLIPGLNIILWIIIWMRIARLLQKSGWWSLLMCIPLVNIAVLWFLATSNKN
ncbi:MAG: hypothetical protein HQL26_05045 [Candidatus Omnitrophica bacterium]|nr:hypothetical protein [Candidatus Omnitrophota bacterium]